MDESGVSVALNVTQSEAVFIYGQLSARKNNFRDDITYWSSNGVIEEVERCVETVKKIEGLMDRILSAMAKPR